MEKRWDSKGNLWHDSSRPALRLLRPNTSTSQGSPKHCYLCRQWLTPLFNVRARSIWIIPETRSAVSLKMTAFLVLMLQDVDVNGTLTTRCSVKIAACELQTRPHTTTSVRYEDSDKATEKELKNNRKSIKLCFATWTQTYITFQQNHWEQF